MENSNTAFTFAMAKGNSSIIKVIGVGGGGNNALKHMYERGIHGVDFVICNTDAQTLDNNPVANKVQLGLSTTEGLGAGADPEVGEKAAIESIDEIKAALGQNTKMVFVTAGMGGGTGTGAAPVVAKIAREMGILTVGIVTVPFGFEGRRRIEQAEAGLEKLRENVDSLIVINNDKLRQQFGNLGFKQAFSKADEVLTNAAKGMAEVITAPFAINIDFRDAKSVLQNSGTALMSTGIATGEKRAEEAVRKALDSPLLNDNKITGAKDVLLLILSGNDEAHEATMDEIGLINDYVQTEAGGNNQANVIFGVGTDEELGDAIKVLVIATGFAKENKKHDGPTEKIKLNLHDSTEPRIQRESPFKNRSERNKTNESSFDTKNFFRLDDEEDYAPQFKSTNTKQTMPVVQEVREESKYFVQEDYQPEVNFTEEASKEPDLFTYEDLETESFSFEVEKPIVEESKNSFFSEEKPIEFTFEINEPSENEPFVKKDKGQFVQRVKNEVKQEEILKPIVSEEKKEEVKQETTIKEAKIETQEEFTFITKPAQNDRVNERRNKLKEFNSRYHNYDETVDFEAIPAFRRKNIEINDFNASEQNINSFLSENDGRMQLRENKFLNKDVD